MNPATTTKNRTTPSTLLGVWAHPDDEAYLSAGLMGRVRDAGGRVVCVHATFGDRGTSDPASWPPERLAAHRRAELAASLAVVGVSEHIGLGYADGSLADLDPAQPELRLIEIIDRVRPDAIVTFGPDGVTGHPDHVAVCRWTTAAWSAAYQPGDLFYATTTDEFVERHAEMYRELALSEAPGLPVRTPRSQIALDIALADWELDRKRAALAAHASQTQELAHRMGEHRYRHWFDHETFRRPTASEHRSALTRRRVA